jgi:hypothetical protein
MRIWGFLTLISFAIISCQGNTDRIYKLDNKSAYNLRLKAKVNAEQSYQIDTTIPAGLRNVMAIFSEPGGETQADENPGAIFSEFELKTTTGKTFNKDINSSQTWQKSVIERSSMPSNQEHLYLLEITDSDFQ